MQRPSKPTASPAQRSSAPQAGRTASGQVRAAGNSPSRASAATSPGAGNPANSANQKTVVCRKCKSPQIAANKRGYSFAYLFTCLVTMILFGIFLFILNGVMLISANTASAFGFLGPLGLVFIFFSLPVSILVGFVGRSTIVNGCMNCGHKWTPAKKK
ncbi:hypothetical protein [Paenibacillus sp. TH7-28]